MDQPGRKLMSQVFGGITPKLDITTTTGQNAVDEWAGSNRLFMGAAQGLRNPRGHETPPVDTAAEGSSLYQVGLVIEWVWSRRGGLTRGDCLVLLIEVDGVCSWTSTALPKPPGRCWRNPTSLSAGAHPGGLLVQAGSAVDEGAGPGGAPAAKRGRTTWTCGEQRRHFAGEEAPMPSKLSGIDHDCDQQTPSKLASNCRQISRTEPIVSLAA
jgi:hypothetical protein